LTINQQTMLLDQSAWDLVLDANGNWAAANAPYSLAQDVASAVRTFLGECYYNQNLGVPYWQQILGKYPPLSFVRQTLVNVALTVPNVVSARVVFSSFSNRVLSGQVQFIDTDGEEASVGFGDLP
jgi:hypothetical protein